MISERGVVRLAQPSWPIARNPPNLSGIGRSFYTREIRRRESTTSVAKQLALHETVNLDDMNLSAINDLNLLRVSFNLIGG